LMREQGLVSKIRRKKYNSYRGTVSHIADNVLGRRFIQDAPNKGGCGRFVRHFQPHATAAMR
ncbi:hypothetical protein I4J35_14145, partial [Corynebacterium belfantii]|uniref:hypothetical protein n=1 Tax=Corynebacterium belfantii TaxID=2014537 RepID=UPI0018D2A5F2|nr:hypothetical protein [Corynebacterium belfantii]MBG9329772.1 hypothetical protein [Corynebacterium belfantii]